MTIIEAASKLRPGTAWNLRDGILEQAKDGTPRVTSPTLDELQVLVDAESYKAKRQAEYPKIEDQLDAIWAGGQDEIDMRDQILAIKVKYPKI